MLNEFYEFLFQEYLPKRYPTIFHLHPFPRDMVENVVTHDLIPLTPPPSRSEALQFINSNIDEDFLMLLPSPDGDGYTLQSFVWAYPVGFSPSSKLGLKLRDAHKPVPGYKAKLEKSMDRYFEKLEVGDVRCRASWAVATNDELCVRGEYHFYDDDDDDGRAGENGGGGGGGGGKEKREKEQITKEEVEKCWVRCELQTLFALPKSGGRVLSVHLYLYPLREIREVGLGKEMCEAIDGLKGGNVPGFWRYKR